ncbi:MAG: hypothetical protein IKJ68_03215 [Clostridia bacterium]|nr:hypothetical protein [Clostridia bacterium]
MLNIAICDDELIEIEYLTSLVQEWANATKTVVNTSSFTSAEAFLLSMRKIKISIFYCLIFR